MSLVYKITNNSNGKFYIGYTGRSLKERWSEHIRDSKVDKPLTKFHRALKKYGISNFTREVIQGRLSRQDALDLEDYLIDLWKPEYNTSKGGYGGGPWTDAARFKHSQKQKGRKASEAALVNIRAAATKRGRPVICTSDNKCYPSTSAAARAYGLSSGNMQKYCKTGMRSRTGLGFFYADQLTPLPPKIRKQAPVSAALLVAARLNAQKQAKKVICLEDGLVYDNLLTAAKCYGIEHTVVCGVCRGKRLSAHGLHFAYYTKSLSEVERQILIKDAERKHESSREARRHPVICLNDGKVYKSVHAAADAYKIAPASIPRCCKTGSQTIDGLRFRYADQEQQVAEKPPLRKRIISHDDGVIYESGTAAAKALGRSLPAVMASIKKNRRCAGKRLAYAA